MRRAFLRLLQGVIIAAAAYFLARTVIDGHTGVRAAFQRPDWPALIGLFAAAVAAMVWIAWIWVLILHALESRIPVWRGIGAYFVGEATKYLPGAFWPVLGRGELAVRLGAARNDAYVSVLMSLLFNFVLAGLVASAAIAPFALAAQTGSLAPLWLITILPVGIAALHPRVLNRFLSLTAGLLRRPLPVTVLPWRTSVLLILAYLPAWALIGLATALASRIVGAPFEGATLLLAAYLGWVAGFLAIPAPTGLGVREGVFAALLSPVMSVPLASAIALTARAAFVFADAAGAFIGLLALRPTNVDESGINSGPT